MALKETIIRGGLLIGLLWLIALPLLADSQDDGDVWLLVDSQRDVLEVRNGDRVVASFRNVARGQAGVVADRRRHSRKTPSGEFHVGWVNENSRFHHFFGLDYPRPDHARRALDAGDIDVDTYLDILAAGAREVVPPQDTVLGGHIGIHGIGEGDPGVHEAYHWTDGCVALTNEQLDELTNWVEVGTRVVIR